MSDQPDSTQVTPTPDQQSSPAGGANSATPPIQATADQGQSPQPYNPTADVAPNAPDPVDATQGNGAQRLQDLQQQGAAALSAADLQPTDPTTAGMGTQPTNPIVPLKPYVAAPAGDMTTPPNAHPWVHRLLSTAKALGEGLTGGPQYTTSIDANGNTTRTPVQSSWKGIGMALALEAIGGGLAGAGEHGPNATGAAAGKGLQEGQQIAQTRADQQQQADQKAQQDYIRKFETFKANMSTFQSMQNVGKQDYEIANAPVAQYAAQFQWMSQNNPGLIGQENVSEQESVNHKDFPATEYYRIPTQTLPQIDPTTGKQVWQNQHGQTVPPYTPFSHPQWIHRYAMIHMDGDAQIKDPEGNLDPNIESGIEHGVFPAALRDAAQGSTMPMGPYIQGGAKVNNYQAFEALVGGKNGILSQVQKYRDLVNSGGQASPSAFDPAASTPTDNIYALFGGNLSKLSDFIVQHEGQTNPDGSPSRAARNNNPGNLVADASWKGPVDATNLPPGQAPFRVYASKEEGQAALDNQLMKWQKENPNQSIQDFFKRYTAGDEAQKNYVQAALLQNGAANTNSTPSDMPAFNLKEFIAQNPGADRAVQEFMRQLNSHGNTKGSVQYALDAMRNTNQRAIILKALNNDAQAGVDYDAARNNQQKMAMDMSRNQAKLQYNDQKRQQEEAAIIARNENTINAMAHGAAVDPTSILTMRAYDREIVFNELEKRTNGQYNLASVRNMIDLNKEINDKYTAGSFGNQVANANTAWGHTSAANEDLKQLENMVPGLMQNTSLLGKPLSEVAKYFEGVSPEASHMYQQYLIDMHSATTDWQNLLNNQHALQESDKEMANNVISGTASFGNAHAALQGMMRNATNRIIPLDQRYGDTMSRSPNERVHFPNMIQPQTVEAIRKMNDPEVIQRVAHMESGGTITGQSVDPKTGGYTVGQKGKEVGLLLTPAAPQQGAKPTPQVLQQYVRVYGANKADVQRAMQANGWTTQF